MLGSFFFFLIAFFTKHSQVNVTIFLTLGKRRQGQRPRWLLVWGTSLLTTVAIHLNLFLCVHTCIAVNLCGCPFITISPGAFRGFDYFLHLRNEKTEAWRRGVPHQRSSFEPSSGSPRTPTLAPTPGNPQGKSSIWFPHVLCAQP